MIPTSQTTEMRIKKHQLQAIITCYNSKMNVDEQNKAIGQWENKAAKVIIVGNRTPIAIDGKQETSGYMFVPSKDSEPSIVEALDYYHKRGGPEEVVAICAANVNISEDNSVLHNFLFSAQMNRAWGGFIKIPGSKNAFDAFVVSGYVLDFIRREIPGTLTFAEDEWAKWFDGWMRRKLNTNRYFDASKLGVVLSTSPVTEVITDNPVESTTISSVGNTNAPLPVLKAVEAHKSPVIEVTPEPQPEPVKKKRGRPVGYKVKKKELV